MDYNKKLLEWKNKILRRVNKWRKSVLSKYEPKHNLEEISLEGIVLKVLKTRYFGRFRSSGLSRVIGLYKGNTLVGLTLHYPSVWLKGENEAQRLNINQRIEVFDKNGRFCDGALGHPIPELHVKYELSSIVTSRSGEKYTVKLFALDEAPRFRLDGKEIKASLVIYKENKPKWFSPHLPLAGKSIFSLEGNIVLKFSEIKLTRKILFIMLEGIMKEALKFEKVPNEFPKCVAILLGVLGVDRSQFIIPKDTLPTRNYYPAKF